MGLKNRSAVFKVQREVNGYSGEPLMAVLPGVALDQLWQVVGVAERVLLAVSAMVVAVGLAGLVAVVLAGLNERRRELAILRSVGARPREIFFLLMIEAWESRSPVRSPASPFWPCYGGARAACRGTLRTAHRAGVRRGP